MRNPHSLSHSTPLSPLAYSTKSVTMETIFYGSLPTIHGDLKLKFHSEIVGLNKVVYCMDVGNISLKELRS